MTTLTNDSAFLSRFWNKVEKTSSCWEWKAASSGGYGYISVKGQNTRVSRVSYELHFGKIPQGLYVCHKCDNPGCVRPDHLFLGTALDNARDRDNKGRRIPPAGTSNGYHKLSEKNVLDIIEIYKSGQYSQEQLGKKYGISQAHVSRLIKKQSWRHI